MASNNAHKLITVIGITGKQGGAVAKHLLQSGFKVRGLTREVSTPKAKSWAEKGVEIVAADLDDVESLKSAFQGTYGVFLVTANPTSLGPKNETKYGKNAADASKFASVQHFVFSSVGNASEAPNVPHFQSKYLIERYIADELRLPHTIIRPAFFYENYDKAGFTPPRNGSLTGFIRNDVKLQMVAVDDIGVFVDLAFRKPDKYLGKVVELSGDELTGDEMADVLTKVTGEKYSYSVWWFFKWVLRYVAADMREMAKFFEEVGYKADIPALRKEHPELQTWETWLRLNQFEKK
ncbi:hypothetical protein BC937DRAFT_92184 [Endogone sp. FLAS-F59071]|nr:hypothetical protein BC937DRAFT_92184 [Endogone sp. FLAS-F59071]|eukprot:RUS15650.1 hypothetical protein BC937DRAFT_92184 [Endogone sp. FLAS-F59071]